MINYVYQLISPQQIGIKLDIISMTEENLIVRPLYMSICRADHRYFWGKRDKKVLEEKLPMALIHECCGEVVYSPDKNTFKVGDKVVIIPNLPITNDIIVSENYREGTKFRSSNCDGFMQEVISVPMDRVIKINGINLEIASFIELLSVAYHAIDTFNKRAHARREHIAIWGDGSLGYIVSCLIKHLFPSTIVSVIGKHSNKLELFSFADNIYREREIKDDFKFDHAFECVGGSSAEKAVSQIIAHIKPEGTVTLLGVSEDPILINTRKILEKGITLIGRSRSGKKDFENVVKLLNDKRLESRFKVLIDEVISIRSIYDIYEAFKRDLINPFKTILEWNI